MQKEEKKTVLLTDKSTGNVYEYLGIESDKICLANLSKGTPPGLMERGMVKKGLGISVHLNQLANDNPAILEAIKALNLGVIL